MSWTPRSLPRVRGTSVSSGRVINFNAKHTLADKSELLADLDMIKFDITGDQYFQTQLDMPGSPIQVTKGNIPSDLKIFTAKVDYSKRFKNFLLETGLKTAKTNTDNLAQYYFYDGNHGRMTWAGAIISYTMRRSILHTAVSMPRKENGIGRQGFDMNSPPIKQISWAIPW